LENIPCTEESCLRGSAAHALLDMILFWTGRILVWIIAIIVSMGILIAIAKFFGNVFKGTRYEVK
jgi:hypothetical protein